MGDRFLEAVGTNMAQMKLPLTTLMSHSALRKQDSTFSVDRARNEPRPGVNLRDAGDDLSDFHYVVRADPCLDEQGVPAANAFWSPDRRSLTLCYAFVNLVANVGMAQIAEQTAGKR